MVTGRSAAGSANLMRSALIKGIVRLAFRLTFREISSQKPESSPSTWTCFATMATLVPSAKDSCTISRVESVKAAIRTFLVTCKGVSITTFSSSKAMDEHRTVISFSARRRNDPVLDVIRISSRFISAPGTEDVPTIFHEMRPGSGGSAEMRARSRQTGVTEL